MDGAEGNDPNVSVRARFLLVGALLLAMPVMGIAIAFWPILAWVLVPAVLLFTVVIHVSLLQLLEPWKQRHEKAARGFLQRALVVLGVMVVGVLIIVVGTLAALTVFYLGCNVRSVFR